MYVIIFLSFDFDLNLFQLVGLAFTTLGNDGRMPMTEDHHCSECTKPYKPRANEDPAIAENAAPVQMAVMDGIVIGPVVSFQSYFKFCI